MKKFISVTSALILSCSALGCISASAEESTASVYVTAADSEGKLVLVQEPVTVTDADGDGSLTINDALYLAHEAKFEGGAAVGYGSAESQYGLSLTKLWGTENGGGYGYYVNNGYAMGLRDAVKDGDIVSAFVYTDLDTYSDTFCFFDINNADAKQGDELELTLSYYTYDENYSPVKTPVQGAEITVNGADSGAVTDAEGKTKVTIGASGKVLVSAKSASMNLVPPVCVVNAAAAPEAGETSTTTTTTSTSTTTSAADDSQSSSPATGDHGAAAMAVILGVSAAAAFALRRRNED